MRYIRWEALCQASTDRPRLRTEFPLVRALAPALASYDGAAELDRGLDLLRMFLTG